MKEGNGIGKGRKEFKNPYTIPVFLSISLVFFIRLAQPLNNERESGQDSMLVHRSIHLARAIVFGE
jgi:hypothetical protein